MPLALDPLTSAVLEGLLWYAVFGLLGAGTGLALLHQQRRGDADRDRPGRRPAGRREVGRREAGRR